MNREYQLPAGTRKPAGTRVPVFISSDPTRQTGRISPGIPAGYPGNSNQGHYSPLSRHGCDVRFVTTPAVRFRSGIRFKGGVCLLNDVLGCIREP